MTSAIRLSALTAKCCSRSRSAARRQQIEGVLERVEGARRARVPQREPQAVDGGPQLGTAEREWPARSSRAAGGHDRHEVVGLQFPVDEALQAHACAVDALERHPRVVDDQGNDAPRLAGTGGDRPPVPARRRHPGSVHPPARRPQPSPAAACRPAAPGNRRARASSRAGPSGRSRRRPPARGTRSGERPGPGCLSAAAPAPVPSACSGRCAAAARQTETARATISDSALGRMGSPGRGFDRIKYSDGRD